MNVGVCQLTKWQVIECLNMVLWLLVLCTFVYYIASESGTIVTSAGAIFSDKKFSEMELFGNSIELQNFRCGMNCRCQSVSFPTHQFIHSFIHLAPAIIIKVMIVNICFTL